ncbi:MAG: hypothetical protein RL701_1916 [Pseudomonadota bacterium]|jgi:hypothetical protein
MKALAFVALLSFAACTAKATPFDRLCKVYEGAGGKPLTSELAVDLGLKAQKEVPEIYDEYTMVLLNGGDRYAAFKDVATSKGQPNWECEAMRKMYAAPPPQ